LSAPCSVALLLGRIRTASLVLADRRVPWNVPRVTPTALSAVMGATRCPYRHEQLVVAALAILRVLECCMKRNASLVPANKCRACRQISVVKWLTCHNFGHVPDA